MATDELSALDALMARFPALRCTHCGFTGHAKKSSLLIEVQTTSGIGYVDPKNKEIWVSDNTQEVDTTIRGVWCGNCDKEFPLPDGWGYNYNYQPDN